MRLGDPVFELELRLGSSSFSPVHLPILMETDIYVCVEAATRSIVAVEIEARGYVRKDDPYFLRGTQAYLNQEFFPIGTVLTETQLADWESDKVNSNDRDILYKLEGPKISTSVHIDGFKA